MIEKRNFYIDGEWVAPKAAQDYEVIDPSTEDPCAVISLGDQADTDAAVAAAKAALPGWKAADPAERIAAVERIAKVYAERAEDMAQAISLEMGAPIDLARKNQWGAGAYHIKNFIDAAKAFEWVHPLGDGTPGAMIAYEPVGVVGLITPWNWPMNQVTLKVIPAILAGCTMVLKPSEEAPLSSLIFAEILDAAGLPKGVFNLVNGDGAGVGTQLSTHPDVEMISFTGSTRAGRAISKAAADTLKRVTLELGGKGANLIFADADEDAVARGVKHCFQNSGQSCNAPTRMLVERSAYDRAVEVARQTAEATQVASPREEGKHIGPVINKAQFDKIQGLIETGIAEGAKLVAGGPGRPEHLNRGFYVRPTVFADCDPSMTIMNEEIFGPVLSIMPFDSEEQAIEVANATPYGLTNYLQSGDGARRNRLARQLRSGMVEMNGQDRGAGAPFGGVGSSGRAREGGRWGIEEFCDVKSISGWAE
ncbi:MULTISPECIES: aldehyde dehydrogenase family protein [Thioclava]|uniref:aldehyde dehydrogenase (NAD(+)) n=1 Tax=Thioclava nitratireducens TaxID=1915078 RepID=A0ABM6IKZ8_9RHOB|nr:MULTISPECIES: aldehyde dehydrogenase family protein [Thioclava]AQS49575.1 aldehyde dehydrogenase family protein [Thioclava nitratireducens]OWY00108.1 aldehyde dehydrogenase family protein [Thioclava sp. IC9]OWY00716.1 aldehyde dehydrogenase family protein [Thioclava sp. F1Mire-8]OWY07778.1 aldehyde dehydrogenase family protein [Thioclava sp. F42-5]OWY13527.1 aldehyde dehydrogenase family protein [Thioclava sp. JM3]